MATLFLPNRSACLAAEPVQSGTCRVATVDDDTLELAHLETKFQTIADRVAPSVVAVSAAFSSVDSDDAVRGPMLSSSKLDAMLEQIPRSVGTGVVIDASGFILTNEHVVAGAKQLWITTDDRKVYPAIIVGSDPRSDLAVLKAPAVDLVPAHFAATGSVRRGQWTISLGNPYGLAGLGQMAMSVGVVSAVDRSLPRLASQENRLYSGLIQTTAQINPGNSGGPLFDLAGDVIGLTTAVILPQKQTNGIGFAMPVTEQMMAKAGDLKQGREIVYGYLGVTVANPTPDQYRDSGASSAIGACVEAIEAGSPAAAVSLKVGDVIIAIAGQPVQDSNQFVRLAGSAPIDRPSDLQVYRAGKKITLSVTPVRRESASVAVTKELQRLHWRGLVFGPLPSKSDATSKSRRIQGVMVLGVDPASPLAKNGMASGAVVTSIAGKPVTDLISLQQILNDTPAEQCKLTIADPTTKVAAIER